MGTMDPIFLKVEPLPAELQQDLVSLGAQPFSSRGIDGSTVSDGFVIAALTAPVLELLRAFVVNYFKYQSQKQDKGSLQVKFKGATLTGYTADQVLQILDKIQQNSK